MKTVNYNETGMLNPAKIVVEDDSSGREIFYTPEQLEYYTEKENDDMVNHPLHYQSETGIEVIDVIEAFTKNLNGIEATDTGNIIKYICRWKHKNGLQDLKKAQWYLNHLINHIEKESCQ